MRLLILTAFAAAGVACGHGAERRTARDTLIVRGGEVVTRPLSKEELARFAVLPTVMASPKMERTARKSILAVRCSMKRVSPTVTTYRATRAIR